MTEERKSSAFYCSKNPDGDSHGPNNKQGRCSLCGFRDWSLTETKDYYARFQRAKSTDTNYDEQWNPDYDGGLLIQGTANYNPWSV